MRNDRGQVVFEHRAEVTLTPVAFELYDAIDQLNNGRPYNLGVPAVCLYVLVREADADESGEWVTSIAGVLTAMETAAELADFLGL